MTRPLAYATEAREDIDTSFSHYEQRLPGLGDRFLQAVRRCVERIVSAPEAYGVVEADLRAAPLKRFPHLVIYRVEADRVLVIAVQHGRRNP